MRTKQVAMMKRKTYRHFALASALLLVAAACGGGNGNGSSGPSMDPAEAQQELQKIVDDVGWRNEPVTRSANISSLGGGDLAETLPPIDEFPIVISPGGGSNQVVVEIFASTEKSGSGTDGWIVEVAEAFNDADQRLGNGSTAKVAIRKIASGTGYLFIASGDELPDGFSPSNRLWVEMAATHQPMTEVASQLVPNVAGIVMKEAKAEELRTKYGTLDAKTLVNAVIAGDVVMGYTNPFASSTGLNFLLTVLDDFADGDESRLVAGDVASVFEEFQQRVPFVALTTLQLRESVEKDAGTLDAFVMEWQTFVNTDSLKSGFEFIPFGVSHDNPLFAVGEVSTEKLEALQLFAAFAGGQQHQDLGKEFGFDPPSYTSQVSLPSGATLVQAQELWKEKKDGGKPVAAVFVTDVSGSMAGSRIVAVRRALESAREFISESASVGMVEFNEEVALRLPVAEFDLVQQGRFQACIEDMTEGGGTAMYDGVALGLKMLIDVRAQAPDTKVLLIVLTDGETQSGNTFDDIKDVIEGLRIPVYTVGFEADLAELGRLSSLVEAASINASEDDVEFKIASLFNAGV